ncbi:MAG: Gfo/Idh/MocA family protein [Terriglobales bacterium]
MVQVGFTGGGNITETHIRAAAEAGLQIAAIYGTNEQKLARLAHTYRGTAYSDFDQFLAHKPMNMVMIGSPSALHAEQGIAAAEHGLHVLVEKPIDTSTKRADALIDAARRSRVKLGVIFQDRLKPDILRLKEWIDSGKLGKPMLVEASVKWYRPPEYYSGSRWRGTLAFDGGGALINQGIHTVDLLVYLLGDVTRVQATAKTALHSIESEDTCVATLEFANGAIGVLHATTAAYPGYARRLEITGSEGTVRIEHDRITKIDLRKDVEADGLEIEHASELGDQNASANSPVVGDVRGHQRIVEDFISAIETGRNPVCDGEEGRRSLAIVESIYRAARTGAAVVMRADARFSAQPT